MLRRRGRVLIVTTILVANCAFGVASLRGHSYSAEGVAVVAANARLTPDQANRLAVTYSAVIPNDEAITRYVADSLRTPASQIRNRISVFNDTGTALLRIDYRGTSPANASAGAEAALRSVAGANPASPNVAPGSVGIVLIPHPPSASKRPWSVAVIGGILGLALGVLLLVAWERADPRIDRIESLSAELGCPSSGVEAIEGAGGRALVERWRTLAGSPRITVALLPVTERVAGHLHEIAMKLPLEGTPEETLAGSELGRRGGRPSKAQEAVTLIPGCVPGQSAGEELAMACDLTVLVVERGTRRTDVRQSRDTLERFGVAPVWAIFRSKTGNEAKLVPLASVAPSESRRATVNPWHA